jgi:hypothetical protein
MECLLESSQRTVVKSVAPSHEDIFQDAQEVTRRSSFRTPKFVVLLVAHARRYDKPPSQPVTPHLLKRLLDMKLVSRHGYDCVTPSKFMRALSHLHAAESSQELRRDAQLEA